MSHCCTSSNSSSNIPKKYSCPINGNLYSSVPATTIMHHINTPWAWHNKNQGYYFCDDPECEVIYFGQDNSIIQKSQLRTTIGVKENSNDSLVCYCYGITVKQAANHSTARDFVIKQTRQHACACEARNPSGKCCLKDFPSAKNNAN